MLILWEQIESGIIIKYNLTFIPTILNIARLLNEGKVKVNKQSDSSHRSKSSPGHYTHINPRHRWQG